MLDRARNKGVTYIVVPGIDLDTSRRAVRLAEDHPELYAAVGVHPSEASSWDENTLNELRQLASHPKVAAVGEIGLDYYRDASPRPAQLAVFKIQLDLAQEMNLPVVVHNRESTQDTWRELLAWHARLSSQDSPLSGTAGVLHSFEGSLEQALDLTRQGFFIGINGAVTFKNARLRQEVVARLPLDKLLVETDAPFLAPHPHRGKRNEPAFVAYTVEKVAALQQKSYDSIARITAENAARLFRWEL